ncbi:MAG: TetR/AcrR family transcriptional regulator [Solirubrobacterales bacterium]
MTSSVSGPAARPRRPNGRGPRRLSRAAREEQLVAAAIPVVAEHGLSDFPLDEIAAGADVTRNLLYHYFPRGRADVAIAVAEAAGHRLTDDWITDESLPLPERVATNVGRMVEHATEPSDAWRIYQLARGSGDPALRETVDRFESVVIESISRNQLGTADPPPLARIAIQGYLAFFAAALGEARRRPVPTAELVGLLNETLAATLRAAA